MWELIDIPEDLKRVIPDYRINLIQVAFLEEDVIQKFTSNFRIIAEFFRAKRLGKEKEIMYNNKQKWIHVAEMMEFFHTFTDYRRYQMYKAFLVERSKKGEVKMCTLLDAFEKQGIERGIEQGLEQGILIGKYQSADKYAKKHKTTIEDAMEELDFSDEERSGYYAWKTDNDRQTA